VDEDVTSRIMVLEYTSYMEICGLQVLSEGLSCLPEVEQTLASLNNSPTEALDLDLAT
jgi:hypothetical protein